MDMPVKKLISENIDPVQYFNNNREKYSIINADYENIYVLISERGNKKNSRQVVEIDKYLKISPNNIKQFYIYKKI